ncbi:hypothetical protein BDZ89DRAFT_1078027 [Hymenopellis radicata]|nr:hypothetical protein BDZ89DRAFT_1078027 [Hymenopellis radicata]
MCIAITRARRCFLRPATTAADTDHFATSYVGSGDCGYFRYATLVATFMYGNALCYFFLHSRVFVWPGHTTLCNCYVFATRYCYLFASCVFCGRDTALCNCYVFATWYCHLFASRVFCGRDTHCYATAMFSQYGTATYLHPVYSVAGTHATLAAT